MEPLGAGDFRQVGPYRLQARLGSGGMGRVFLGFSPTGRAVAVKVIHPELAADPEFRVRFRREVAAARAVSSAYTAEVVAAEPDEDPPWLATVLVRGPSLAEAVLGHGPLPAPAVWRLAAGLAEALQAIHSRGLVHRDLKPANVLLAVTGPLVIDFGISRALEGTTMTATGLVVGTPSFMSPEQAMGDPVTPASDVFSLGSLIVFAATGAGPFGDGQPAPVLYRVVHLEPALDAVPVGLRELASACLIKHPAYRPALPALIQGIRADAPTHTASLTSFWPDVVTNMIHAHQASLGVPAEDAALGDAVPDRAGPARALPDWAGPGRTTPDVASPDVAVPAGAAADAAVSDGAVSDGAVSDGAVPDGAVLDGAVPGAAAAGATRPDGAAPGGAVPGGAVPGAAAADATRPDAAVPDGAMAGGAAPAAAAADAAVSDGAVPDGAAPGGAVPDVAVPADAARPEGAVPDAAVPDGAAPGGAVPDVAVPADGAVAGNAGPGWAAGPDEPRLEQVALEPAVPPVAASAPAHQPADPRLAAGAGPEQGGPATVDRPVPAALALAGTGPTPAPALPADLARPTVPPGALPPSGLPPAGPGGRQTGDPTRRRVLAGLAGAAAVGLGVAGWELSQGGAPRRRGPGAAGHNPAGTRITHRPTSKPTATSPPPGTQIWMTNIPATLFSNDYTALVAAGTTAYITDAGNNLNALRTTDGALVWRIAVPNGGQGPGLAAGSASPTNPLVIGSAVYVGGFYNDVMAVRAADGATLWRKAIGSGVYSGIAVGGGNVYTVGWDAYLWALSGANGSTAWGTPVPGGQTSDPSASAGAVYVVDNSQNLHAQRAANGSALWTVGVPGGADSQPLPVGSLVYIIGKDNKLHALDAASGSTAWAIAIPGGAAAAPTVAGGVMYLTGGDSNLYALNAARGTVLWHAPISGGAAVETNDQNLTALAPAVAGGVVYVAGSDSKLYALSTTGGTVLWSTGFASGDGAASSPAVVNGVVCIAGYDNNVYGFAA